MSEVKPINKSERRKKLIMFPKFQYKFLVYMSVFALVTSLIYLVAIFRTFSSFHDKGIEFGIPKDNLFFEYLFQQHTALLATVLIVTSVCMGFFLFAGLLLSHKIAGPLYHFQQHMKDINNFKEGNELKFRKNDYFSDLAETYNAHIKQIKEST